MEGVIVVNKLEDQNKFCEVVEVLKSKGIFVDKFSVVDFSDIANVRLSIGLKGGNMFRQHVFAVDYNMSRLSSFSESFHAYVTNFNVDDYAVAVYMEHRSGGYPMSLDVAIGCAKALYCYLRKADDMLTDAVRKVEEETK